MQIKNITKLLSLLSPEQRHVRIRRSDYPPHWQSKQQAPQHPKTLGERIKCQRLELRLCQETLANQIGVNTHTIYCWEHGIRRPSRRFRLRIEGFLAQNLCSTGCIAPQLQYEQEPHEVQFDLLMHKK
jgi:DNA-binding XRE family transcriptional regulator